MFRSHIKGKDKVIWCVNICCQHDGWWNCLQWSGRSKVYKHCTGFQRSHGSKCPSSIYLSMLVFVHVLNIYLLVVPTTSLSGALRGYTRPHVARVVRPVALTMILTEWLHCNLKSACTRALHEPRSTEKHWLGKVAFMVGLGQEALGFWSGPAGLVLWQIFNLLPNTYTRLVWKVVRLMSPKIYFCVKCKAVWFRVQSNPPSD